MDNLCNLDSIIGLHVDSLAAVLSRAVLSRAVLSRAVLSFLLKQQKATSIETLLW